MSWRIGWAVVVGSTVCLGCGSDKDSSYRPNPSGSGGSVASTGGGGSAGEAGSGAAGSSSGGTAGGGSGGGAAGTAGAGGTGGAGPDLTACFELCEWEVSLTTDCPADALSQCKSSFKVGAMVQGGACVPVMLEWCGCLMKNVDPTTVSCTEGAVTSNIPVATLPPECNTVNDSYGKCMSGL